MSFIPWGSARLRAVVALFALCGAILAMPVQAAFDLLAMTHEEALDVCESSGVNTDPWLQGIAIAQPGRWWNARRYGTGWDLVYSDDRSKLKAFIYTFNEFGHSTWLATDMIKIEEAGDTWNATVYQYTKATGGAVTKAAMGEVHLRFFRDDPSRLGARWKWNRIPVDLMPGGALNECLSDMTRLNPAYYAGFAAPPVTKEFSEKQLAADPVGTTVLSGYWNGSTSNPQDVDEVPGVVMTIMQTSLGNDRGKFGEAAVKLLYNGGSTHFGQPIFVQAQRTTLVPAIPLFSDTFNLYFHYGTGYPNGYAVNDCIYNAAQPNACNNNQRVGTYTRNFKPETNYRSAHTTFAIEAAQLDVTTGAVPNAPLPATGAKVPAYLSSGSSGGTVTRTARLQEISVNQYTCQAPTGGACSLWVNWAGNGIGKPWRRDLSTLMYSAAPLATEDFGIVEQVLQHGGRAQFELWQGTPGTPGGVLLDRTPEVRAVGPTPSTNGPIEVPPAPVITNAGDLPANDASVGTLAGEPGVDGGAATYRVPIDVPPGRNGMQPSVALSYSSRGGNGAAGLGWSLSAGGSIARCGRTPAQDAETRGVRLDGGDRLCLDGQRLVATSGSYGAVDTLYGTEIDSFTRVKQTVAPLNAGGVCFSVDYKDGRKATFGCSPAGYYCSGAVPRVRPKDKSLESSWLLSRVEDRNGNLMDYCYREFGPVNSGEILLDQIRYTGSTQAGAAAVRIPTRSVKFDYLPRPTGGSANDQSVSGIAGGMLSQTQRLVAISTFSPDTSLPARLYKLRYDDPIFSGKDYSNYSGRSLLRRIIECGYEANGTEVCREPTEFTWSDGNWEFTSRKFAVPATSGLAPTAPMPPPVWQEGNQRAVAPDYKRQSVAQIGDLDGDGTREMLIGTNWYVGRDRIYEAQIAKVTADRVTQGIVTLLDYPWGESADIDGDGTAELVGRDKIYKWNRGRGAPICNSGATSCSGNASSYFQTVTTNLPAGEHDFIRSVADFNGDGAPDVLMSMNAGSVCDFGSGGTKKSAKAGVEPPGGFAPLCLFLNTRPGPIGAGTTAFNFAAPLQIALLYAGTVNESVQHVTDFDGDGTSDIVVGDANGVQRLFLGQLNGGTLSYVEHEPSTLGFRSNTKNLRWMDINGDGLDDIVVADVPGGAAQCLNGHCFASWVLQINRGGSLGPQIYPASPAGTLSPGLSIDRVGSQWQLRYFSKMIQTDIDSDGRPDLLYPAHFAARMCFGAFLTNNQFLTPRPPQDCPDGMTCDADVCAAPPPEDGTTYVAHPGGAPTWADAFKSGLGEVDPSVYRYNAIRFVQTGPDSFRIQVDPTSVIAGASRLGGQRGHADDYYGDGLADVAGEVSCPLRPTQNFPINVCRLAYGAMPGGGLAGPGSPTSYLDSAQTIPLGTIVDNNNGTFVLNENHGDGARTNLAPMLPDLVTKVVNGFGDQTYWDYHPLSSDAGRVSVNGFPFYTLDIGYVDSRHYLFRSSMPVVSTMSRSNGVSTGSLSHWGSRSQQYAYEGAMLNAAGRGFQGFRKITHQNIGPSPRVVRTATTYHQKFPLTGRVERIEASVPGVALPGGRLTLQTFDWRCDRSNVGLACPGQDGSATTLGQIHWPFLNFDVKRSYDLNSAQSGVQLPTGRVETLYYDPTTMASGWTAEGNSRYQRTTSMDGNGTADGDKYFLAARVATTVNHYDTSQLSQWWLDKLEHSTTTTSVSYHPRSGGTPAMDLTTKEVRTSFAWNGERNLISRTTTDTATNMASQATLTYPSPNRGLPTKVVVSGSGVDASRETLFDYTTDGYFAASSTGVLSATDAALNHTTSVLVRASDGRETRVTDRNGIRHDNTYDAFGRVTAQSYLRRGGVTPLQPTAFSSLQHCALSCTGSGEEMAVYYETQVRDGAPTRRAWYDMLGREIKQSARGFDGRWVNVVTKYHNTGSVESTSAPHFDGETPLLTQYTYDRSARVLSKQQPMAELDPAHGDVISTYAYTGLRSDVSVYPSVANACNLAPNLCFSMKRHYNILGQLMRTEDGLAGTYPPPSMGGITDYWFNPGGMAAAIRDGKGNVTTAEYNALGHRVKSNSPDQGLWTFAYNGLGELLLQTDARRVETRITQRDAFGRVLQQRRERPAGVLAGLADEKFLDTWQYDSGGAKGALALVERRRSVAGSPDGTAPVWAENYLYEADSARLYTRTTKIAQGTPDLLSMAYEYRYEPYYGTLNAVTYPNLPKPLTVWRRHSRYGALTSLTDARLMTPLWSMSQADAYGSPTAEQFGYALYGYSTYSRATGQTLTRRWRPYEMPTFTDDLDRLTYSYDSLGNVTTQERRWRQYDRSVATSERLLPQGNTGGNGTIGWYGRTIERLEYDKLQRLTRLYPTRTRWSNAQPADEALPTVNYAYDAVGNFSLKSDYADSFVYGPASGCGPNAVVSATQSNEGSPVVRNYTCDANGNQLSETNWETRHVVYDSDNLPTTITHDDVWNPAYTVDYAYAPGGSRYRRVGPGTTYFGADGYEYAPDSASNVSRRIELGPVVYTQHRLGGVEKPSKVGYQLRDRLGSTIAIANRWGHFNDNDNGGPPTVNGDTYYNNSMDEGRTRRSYDPFGNPRRLTLDAFNPVPFLYYGARTLRGFGGHEHIDRTGLIHMNGRIYDHRLGRFLSVDPLVQAPASSQSLNPYSYVLNNPLAGTDPTGFASCWEEGDCRDLGPARQAFTSKAEFAFGGQAIQGGGPMGNGHLKDPLAMSMQEFHAAIFREAVESGSIGQRANFGFNSDVGRSGQETDRGTWLPGLVVRPNSDDNTTYWAVDQRIERNNRLAMADALVAADGRALVGMQGKLAAVGAGCAITAGGCAAYGLYGVKQDLAAGNNKMAAAGLVLTAVGAGPVAAEFRGLRTATAEVRGAGAVTAEARTCSGGACGLASKCFVAGTLVETSDGPRPIEQIRVGDLVASRDDVNGMTALKPVLRVLANSGRTVVNVVLLDAANRADTIKATPEHPFHVAGMGWVNAVDLAPGDEIDDLASSGLVVQSVVAEPGVHDTYNLEVADFHTYFAGAFNAWVHNSCMSVDEEMSILREAAKAKGNIGVGTAPVTRAEADSLGRAWVGEGYRVSSSGNAWISRDGLRQYRLPSEKASSFATTGVQANLERRLVGEGAWFSNAHVNVIP